MRLHIVLRCFSLCLLFGLSTPASAQTAGTPPAPNDPTSASSGPAYVAQARAMIDAVLAEPEFDRTRTVKELQLKPDSATSSKKPTTKHSPTQKSGTKESSPTDKDWNYSLWGSFFAKSGEIVLWLLVLGLVVLLVAYSKHWLPYLGLRSSRNKPLFLSRQSDSILETSVKLPEDIATAAERLWNEGKKDEALILLYRGTIELLTARLHIDLPQGSTEGEIHLLVGSAMPSFKDDFGNIVRAWLRLAYAHRPPTDIASLLAGFGRLQQAGGAAP